MPQITWPWGYGKLENPMTPEQPAEMFGPYLPPKIDAGEFSLSVITDIPRSVASSVANASRLLFSSNAPAVKQGDPLMTGPAWYDIPGRISNAASGVNEAFQSTLLKIIVLVSIVGIVAVFGMSYVQAKGANLAK
jgi:hypothetical protein